MCHLLNRFYNDTFTGYKVAIIEDGKFFSPATFVEYKVGPVPTVVTLEMLEKRTHWFVDVMSGPAHKENYVGFTSVFRSFFDADRFRHRIHSDTGESRDFTVLKMTLSRELHVAEYELEKVIAGKHIDSVEIAKPPEVLA